MWYKQLTFYPIEKQPDADMLMAALAAVPFVPPSSLEWYGEGFTAPIPFDGSPVFQAGDTMRISLRRDERVIPTSTITEKLNEKTDRIEAEEKRRVGRKEKKELRQAVIDGLLPQALTNSSRTAAILTPHYLMVDSASAARAERLLVALRLALGGLNAAFPTTVYSLGGLLTQWMRDGECECGFEFDSEVALTGAGDAAPIVRIKNKDLTSEDVRQHLDSGMTVTEIGLVWRDQIAFVLTSGFTLKRIRWLDMLTEEAQSGSDSAEAAAYAAQLIQVNNLEAMIGELAELLGGWQE